MIQFALSGHSGVPIYRQIQDQIRFGVSSGRLQAGEQLPTVRALAVELSVNPNTIIKAYTELEREGVLTTEQGTGTFVAQQPAGGLSEADRQAKLESLCVEFLAHAGGYGFTAQEVNRMIRHLLEQGGRPC
ncbi:MAG TPA: GntR family transcriptional regulator [Phycisphaerae bacterium]|nr:GntR family transcriptional regulator [Phycisphaerae bacterium]HRY68348.1 GntR family transcriptional regulator [Phycisphaerae bacterium]HSA26769.1 GntR family transcriptional regulator [Phycisphaerae bacterium]